MRNSGAAMGAVVFEEEEQTGMRKA